MTRMTDFCDIACDKCGWWEPGTEAGTAAQRRVLKKHGWSTRVANDRRLEDICPTCTKEVVEPLTR